MTVSSRGCSISFKTDTVYQETASLSPSLYANQSPYLRLAFLQTITCFASFTRQLSSLLFIKKPSKHQFP
jgi:hypothetical protein